jgi:hypothetical protein
VHTEWGWLISFFLAVIACLLGVIVKQNMVLSEKLDRKLDVDTCIERHSLLKKEQEGIWGALNAHSHTNLPLDSRVIR